MRVRRCRCSAAASPAFRAERPGLARAIVLVVMASACAVAGTTLPLFLGARPSFARPSTSARLSILTPRPGEVIRGDPASIAVELQLEGGKVVPLSSFRLVPNEGHIHL